MDCISRQAVAEVLLKYAHSTEGKAFAEFLISQINDLPPVTPAEKTGRWKKVTAENRDGSISWWYACSECGVPCPKTDHGTDYFGNYCSECGSRMMQEVSRNEAD